MDCFVDLVLFFFVSLYCFIYLMVVLCVSRAIYLSLAPFVARNAVLAPGATDTRFESNMSAVRLFSISKEIPYPTTHIPPFPLSFVYPMDLSLKRTNTRTSTRSSITSKPNLPTPPVHWTIAIYTSKTHSIPWRATTAKKSGSQKTRRPTRSLNACARSGWGI